MPEKGELVIANVYKASQFAAWCKLPEYPDIEGMIHISEAAGKWIFDVKEVIKVGKSYVAKVIGLDPEKKIAKLSLKRVSKRDEKEKWNIYRKEERAEKILEIVAKELGKTLDEAYEAIGFKLQDHFGEMYDGLEKIFKNPQIVEKLKIESPWKEKLLEILKKSFKEKIVKLKAEIEARHFGPDGVEKIKKVLKELKKGKNIKVKYIAAPKYLVEMSTSQPKKDARLLEERLKNAEKMMKKLGGTLTYRMIK